MTLAVFVYVVVRPICVQTFTASGSHSSVIVAVVAVVGIIAFFERSTMLSAWSNMWTEDKISLAALILSGLVMTYQSMEATAAWSEAGVNKAEYDAKMAEAVRVEALPAEVAKTLMSGVMNSPVTKSLDDIDPRLWQHSPDTIVRTVQSSYIGTAVWAVLVGVKRTGKTTTALTVAKDLGNAVFISVLAFAREASLMTVIYDALVKGLDRPSTDSAIEKSAFVEKVLRRLPHLTVVLDLTSPASEYAVEYLDKQIKMLAEVHGIRFIVTASEGTMWTGLKMDSSREFFFYGELPLNNSVAFYNTVTPGPHPFNISKEVLIKMPRNFVNIAKAAQSADGGIALAMHLYRDIDETLRAVLEATCPRTEWPEFAQRLINGKLGFSALYHVCGGNFVTLAKEANMRVPAWFESEYVVPNLVALPQYGTYMAQSDAVQTMLRGIVDN